eukprot:COSAG02_NODE_52394_length_308_cov_0.717703_1_plen_42_part_10
MLAAAFSGTTDSEWNCRRRTVLGSTHPDAEILHVKWKLEEFK